MRFSFGVRRKREGGWRLGTLPVFDLEGWKRESATNGRIVYRPTLNTLFWNVVALVVPSMVVGSLFWTVELPWNWGASSQNAVSAVAPEKRQELERQTQALADDLRRRMTDAQWQEFVARRQQRQEQWQAKQDRLKRTGRWIGYGVWTVLGPLVLLFLWIAARFGLYDLLRYSFDRIELACDESDCLVIRRPRVFGMQEVKRPLQQLSHLAISVREEVSRQPYMHHGWVWFVLVYAKATSDAPPITFSVERVHKQPEDQSPPPAQTKQFVRRLRKLTGLPLR